MDHQLQELTDFGLKTASFFLVRAHERAILGTREKISSGKLKSEPGRAATAPDERRLLEQILEAAPKGRQAGHDRRGKRSGHLSDFRDRSTRYVATGVRPVVHLVPKQQHEFHGE
jgi:hypothetical protein